MDHQRFDELTRALATGASRRGVLKLLAGSALGGMLGLAGVREVAAACRLAAQRCDAGHACCKGGKCANGHCKCKQSDGFFACNGPGTHCRTVTTDEAHCGGCNQPCGENELCHLGGCIDHCQDGRHDEDESDVDCGGALCPKCANGLTCLDDPDCESDFCDVDSVCRAPHFCDDGIVNGRETDIDCGGPGCPPCADGQTCFIDGDCANRFCNNGLCAQRAHCSNGVKDGGETDIDCGGPDCPECGAQQKCADSDDCQGILRCVNRAGDGSDKKFCVECTEDTVCQALSGSATATFVDYFCTELGGTCNADQDLCVVGITTASRCQCGVCRTTTEDAITCIGRDAGGTDCPDDACTSSAQCVNRHGPGAVCIRATGPFCLCSSCAFPC